MTSIGVEVFDGCPELTSVMFNSDAIAHRIRNLFGSQVKEFIFGDAVTHISDLAFSGCSGLTSVTIPESVTYIGGAAFYGCSGLTSVTIPEGVTSIRWSVFSGCSSLTSVTIPEGVKSIDSYAFSDCSGLTSVTSLNPTPPSIGDNTAFANCDPNAILHVPEGCKVACQNSAWRRFFSIIVDDVAVSKQLLSEKREEALKTYESALKVYEEYMSYYDGEGMEHYKQTAESRDANSNTADSVLDDIEQLEKKLSGCGMADEDTASYAETLNAVKEDVTALKGENGNIFVANAFHDKVQEYYGNVAAFNDRLALYKESVDAATTLKELDSIIAEIEQDTKNVESSCLLPVIDEYNGLASIDTRLAQIGEELERCKSQLQSCSDEIDAIITGIVKVVDVESEYMIVYTLNGQPHSVKKNELMSLPKGIYIVNGKKVLIK